MSHKPVGVARAGLTFIRGQTTRRYAVDCPARLPKHQAQYKVLARARRTWSTVLGESCLEVVEDSNVANTKMLIEFAPGKVAWVSDLRDVKGIKEVHA